MSVNESLLLRARSQIPVSSLEWLLLKHDISRCEKLPINEHAEDWELFVAIVQTLDTRRC